MAPGLRLPRPPWPSRPPPGNPGWRNGSGYPGSTSTPPAKPSRDAMAPGRPASRPPARGGSGGIGVLVPPWPAGSQGIGTAKAALDLWNPGVWGWPWLMRTGRLEPRKVEGPWPPRQHPVTPRGPRKSGWPRASGCHGRPGTLRSAGRPPCSIYSVPTPRPWSSSREAATYRGAATSLYASSQKGANNRWRQ